MLECADEVSLSADRTGVGAICNVGVMGANYRPTYGGSPSTRDDSLVCQRSFSSNVEFS